ncbi:hypothetical protein DLAC_10887 [Tieghemostelium lacteum]|uniref:intramembrane prenyl-peptidase Rce1 n=1 Tax=Tieghemostelium lacteum TaxID=361077 RepID=A0A151Z2L3_TIELA|nr:hypothetical protein DLAC_10887 [Tieghemostelium lacteum]|eukprot:KYQ88201.1 hypothetical protein DLAC_10887 [Tieghemostelium lacteum]
MNIFCIKAMTYKLEHLPKLSEFTGILLSCFLSILFVFSLYIFHKSNDRNNPIVIKKRFQSVFSTCLISYIILYLLIPSSSEKTLIFLQLIGISNLGITYFIKATIPLVLTMILFFGPVIMELLEEVYDSFDISFNLYSLRDFVVGPAVEEIVFRSVICPILFFSGFSSKSIIIFSPFLFGFAHIHHAFTSSGDILVKVIRCLIQIAYTSIFGMFTAFVFFRTGNILACILSHSFCNIMGLPKFDQIFSHKFNYVLMATFVIGLVGFYLLIFPMTDPIYFDSIYYILENNK